MSTDPNPYPEPSDGSLVAWAKADRLELDAPFAIRLDDSANPQDPEERWLDPQNLGDDPMCWDSLVRAAGDATPVLLIRRPIARSVPEPEPAPCPEGFHWIGQPWSSCDQCGLPADAHAGLATLTDPSSPFAGGDWVLKPWSEVDGAH